MSPDGKRMAALGKDGVVELCEVESGKSLRKWDLRGEVVAVHYRRDLDRLLRLYGRGALQRDLATAARERRNGRSSAVRPLSSAEKPGGIEYQVPRLKRPRLTP